MTTTQTPAGASTDPQILRLLSRLDLTPNLTRVWDVLTDNDKQVLSAPNLRAIRIAEHWSTTRSVPLVVAIIELAYQALVILQPEYDRLCRRFGAVDRTASDNKPVFLENGQLLLRGQQIHQFRRQRSETRPVRLLDTFQAKGWPSRIESPFFENQDPQTTYDVVSYVNERIECLRFLSQAGGRYISWVLDEVPASCQ